MIDVVLSGAGGRLGLQILSKILEADDLSLGAALVGPGSRFDGEEVGRMIVSRETGIASAEAGAHATRVHAPWLRATSDPDQAIVRGRVLIEAATRAPALEHTERAASLGVPVLLATTGFDRREEKRIQACSGKIPILVAENLSLGVSVLMDLVARASKALEGYHIEIVELHHAKKRDAPSGTACALARSAASARGQDWQQDAIVARSGEIGPRGEEEIGIQSVRGGDIVGEHTVYLVGPAERLELTHRAQSREVFALGAMRALRFLGAHGRASGLYSMTDVIASSIS